MLKNYTSTNTTLIALGVFFIFFIFTLLIARPSFILKNKNGKLVVCKNLLLCFSLLFSLVISITVLLYTTRNNKVINPASFIV